MMKGWNAYVSVDSRRGVMNIGVLNGKCKLHNIVHNLAKIE
jgi:hypothetical protein